MGAATIGWVLAGCIAFGFVVGSLLDKHFGTTYWMPILVLLGIAAGFREMFRTLATLNREDAEQKAKRRSVTANEVPSRELERFGEPASAASSDAAESTGEQTGSRQRIFEVPAPPLPSYMQGSGNVDDQKNSRVPVEDTEDLITKLLGEDEAGPEKDGPNQTHEK